MSAAPPSIIEEEPGSGCAPLTLARRTEDNLFPPKEDPDRSTVSNTARKTIFDPRKYFFFINVYLILRKFNFNGAIITQTNTKKFPKNPK
jgi:hypothetical protein